MPAPPARMRSASVPCGDQLDLDGPLQVLLGQVGVAADEAADRPARPGRCLSSTASPWPWLPQLLLMMVRFLTPLRAMASMQGSALPHRPKPPDMIVMPSRNSPPARSRRRGAPWSCQPGCALTPAPRRTRARARASASSSSASRDHQRRREVDQVVALVHVQAVAAQRRRQLHHGHRRDRIARARDGELERPQQAEAAHLARCRAAGARTRAAQSPGTRPAAAARSTSFSSRIDVDAGDDGRADQRVGVAGQPARQHVVVEVAGDALADDHRAPRRVAAGQSLGQVIMSGDTPS